MTIIPSFHLYPRKEGVYPQKGEQAAKENIRRFSENIFPIPITDEFNNELGEWNNYDVIPIAQEEGLKTQKHVDIRSFVSELPASLIEMLFLDRLSMYELDNLTLEDISSDGSPSARLIVENDESWSAGEVGPQSDRNNWNGIKIECDPEVSEVTTTQSVITQNG